LYLLPHSQSLFFLTPPAPPNTSPLSLHDALPILQHAGVHRIDVLALRHREDEVRVALQSGLDGAQRRRPSGADRQGHTGKQHDLPEGQHRERQSLRHWYDLVVRVLSAAYRHGPSASFMPSENVELSTLVPWLGGQLGRRCRIAIEASTSYRRFGAGVRRKSRAAWRLHARSAAANLSARTSREQG